MFQSANDNIALDRRYALCVGIGTYTNLANRNLRYAVADATTFAERLADPQRGNFVVTLLTQPAQTSKAALDKAAEELLSAADRQAQDLTMIYFSCHGDVYGADNTFCLLPSNATLQANGIFEQTTLISISDLARWFSKARTQNIVMLLDVCHTGGAGVALQHFKLNLSAGPNFFIIGAARQDQVTRQSSLLQHGLFTHCLLRAFEQPPSRDGWLTISQIRDFISEDISWFAKDQPFQIQTWSVSVNSLPLLRNPGYPELSPLPPLWNVPLQRNPFFTAQDDLLSQLANMLQSEQKTALTQPQAISGLGGIGKTQLALEYAYRHRQDYHAVLWGRADTREALISTFVEIASLLDLPQKDEKDQMVIVEAVKAWLADRSKWLLILDNADELALVKEFIPPAFRGHLLLTTRAQAMGGLARKLEVEMMRPEIGALLLLRRSGRLAPEAPLEKTSTVEILEVKELAQELAGLPLALDQAGAYIEETQCSLSQYLQNYRTRRAVLLKRRGGLVPDHPEPVATTWSLAFERVERANPAAIELMRFCAFLAPDAIPEELIIEGASHLGPVLQPVAADHSKLDAALAELLKYSLIRRDSQIQTLTIHRLVQAVIKDEMNEKAQYQWAERAVRVTCQVWPFDEYAPWPRSQRYLPHALVCVELIKQWKLTCDEASALLGLTGFYLKNREQYREAEMLMQDALIIEEKRYGRDDPHTYALLGNLAVLYAEQGRYDEAEPLYRRALIIKVKVFGLEHPTTAGTLDNLAILYMNQGRYDEAEPLYRRALATYEKVLGLEHPTTAGTLDNLAILYMNQGRYDEAEPLYRRALATYGKVLGHEHPETASTLNNLAVLYAEQGRYDEAEPLYWRAWAIREKVFGPDHHYTREVQANYINLYLERGQKTEGGDQQS